MKKVGIKELKASLSKYIASVIEGQQIMVTDRGEAVAVISPLTIEYRVIHDLIQSGEAAWSGEKPLGLKELISVNGRPLSETILEERH